MSVNQLLRHVLLGMVIFFVIILPFVKHGLFEPLLVEYTGGDFAIYYVAAERMVDGKSPYPLEALEQASEGSDSPIWGEYPYPPFLSRFLTPLTRLKMLTAKNVYILLCLTALLWQMHRLIQQQGWGRNDVFWAGMALFGWGPLIYSLRLGQSELLAVPFLAAAWRWIRKSAPASPSLEPSHRWEIVAGLCLGIAAMVRFTPVLMLPALILTGRLRLSAAFVLGSLSTLILTGPWSSWEFFTRVLPTMSDVSRMRDCPALHVQVLHFLDVCAPTEWADHFPILATLTSGAVYVSVLVLFWASRKRLSTESIVLLACFLPPLFAGKNTHHFSVAVFPIIAGMVIFGAEVSKMLGLSRTAPSQEKEDWKVPSRGRLVLLLLWPVALIPSFNYWYPCKEMTDMLGRATSLGYNSLLFFSNLAASVLLFLLLWRSGEMEPDSPKEGLFDHLPAG